MLLATAIVFGFLGSLHCLGMCAPLLWAIPENPEKRAKWWLNKLIYNAGRVSVYALLGLVVGLVGQGVSLVGWQQHISWITGVVLILGLVLSIWGSRIRAFSSFSNQFNRKIKKGLSKTLARKSYSSQLMFGVFNGLLPCGLVYIALIASLSMTSIGGSMAYMALFGLGTIPMMLGAAVFKKSVQSLKGISFNKLYPKIVLTVAILLIVRGMNLGIPYLSPKVGNPSEITICETP
ncbi:sulfite exporter TauE/SafE family protein [Roseivirga sp. E12]|uniref:sulfite exporter TauE/SafE family protein n=1 Tax=Roseivirga sp. E12 TaxID=2819237 RepID=UPI001ABC14A4|nr:sulfite exporter TauE/SafE family protein [Roseivirga sp. E12]MBO3698194.1 sulfite exporter TauE/SafE family protein [Roseivirga sp. E12]